jgi:hypothetical protein
MSVIVLKLQLEIFYHPQKIRFFNDKKQLQLYLIKEPKTEYSPELIL